MQLGILTITICTGFKNKVNVLWPYFFSLQIWPDMDQFWTDLEGSQNRRKNVQIWVKTGVSMRERLILGVTYR